jgi:hypothetical protein
MRIRSASLAAIAGSALVCFAPSAIGQKVSVTYTGSYSSTWSNNSGDYGAGIYSAEIDGVTDSYGIICDDFNDEITANETWNAIVYRASSLTASNIDDTLFGSTIGLSGYAELAALVTMFYNGSTTYGGVTGITQAEISSAMWDITLGGTPTSLQGLDSTAQALVAAVEASFGGNLSASESYLASATSLWILTPAPEGPGEAQEVWTDPLPPGVSAPEGGAALLYLLSALAACCGAMFFGCRERFGSRTAAQARVAGSAWVSPEGRTARGRQRG